MLWFSCILLVRISCCSLCALLCNWERGDFLTPMSLLQFERVENISLADVSKTVDQNGSVINPVLCKAKLMPAILHEKNQLYTGRYAIYNYI